nr:transposase [uncultured Dorea sp.]
MGRKSREWYPGAIYHLMERGIRRMEIFREEMDYEIFLLILKKIAENYRMKVHAYCLMTNHIHLLLETTDYEIGKIMQKIAGDYARTYNRKYGYKGHLFENRYKSCLVKEDAYFLQTSRYIHLNPVKARMAAHPEDYKWSSYRTMIALSDDKITERDKTLAYFKDHSVFLYREFVEDIGYKYTIQEDEIRKSMEEDELWLPW